MAGCWSLAIFIDGLQIGLGSAGISGKRIRQSITRDHTLRDVNHNDLDVKFRPINGRLQSRQSEKSLFLPQNGPPYEATARPKIQPPIRPHYIISLEKKRRVNSGQIPGHRGGVKAGHC
jgi:hypothetical protein|tara:strand:- start:37422 stop:37778 length:357 start_codon:yes stop_codon:yes gene_type:complete